MLTLPTLKAGDSVNIIAPASRCTDQQLIELKKLLESWQLRCVIEDDIFGEDPFCANTDTIRFRQLANALQHPETKAIICARGGYGSMRLIPELAKMAPPKTIKTLVGMSDITALKLYFQQQWHWPTIHGVCAPDRFSAESLASLKSLLFGEVKQLQFSDLSPLNSYAKENRVIKSRIIGGNLSLIQTGIGTIWQLDGRDKIILLEDTGERGYRIDRMLEHLKQAHIFKEAAAILLGDFIKGNEPDGNCFVDLALKRFAEQIALPVIRINGIGHDYTSLALPLGTNVNLQLGNRIVLSCLFNII